MKYRPEIDGLRALAVVPVILFHAGFETFRGGYVGVDVFFVISGYLITSIILADMERGTFSLARFYERRARRILPALFLVVAASLVLGAMWLMPEDRKGFYQSVAAVAVFASNFVFWRQSGYFDTSAELKPLLHTWSLAVEEQYYVLFPLLMLVAWRFGRRWLIGLAAVSALASFALAQWATANHPSAAFFLLPTRAWELLLGVMVALMVPNVPRIGRELGGIAGVALLAVAMLTFDKTTPLPGWPALLPTLGAVAIIICARRDTLVGRLLASKLMVGIGLISYSAYLWHQPLFAFTRIRSIEEPGPLVFAALSLLSVGLAYLTWRFVETPFRQATDARRIFSYSAAGAITLFVVGAVAAARFGVQEGTQMTGGRCNVGAGDCFAAPGSRQVALWGDSYADAFAVDLGKALARNGIALRLFVMNGCPSVVGVMRKDPGEYGEKFARQCADNNALALRTIRQERIGTVVLTSNYQTYLTGQNTAGEPLLIDPQRLGAQAADFLPRRLGETIRATGARVLLVSPHPIVPMFRRDRKALHFGEATNIQADYEAATKARTTLLAGLGDVGFEEVDGRELFCTGTTCPVLQGSDLLLYDGSHLGPQLAERLAQRITAEILKASAQPQ